MFINEDIRNKFSKLNLNVEDGEIPKLKDVKRNYHILAKEKHPNKHSDKDMDTKAF